MVRTCRWVTGLVSVVMVAVGCSAATPASMLPTPGTSATVAVIPSEAAGPPRSPEAIPSTAPTVSSLPIDTPSPTGHPTPRPTPGATWSKPDVVRTGNCSSLTAAIDVAGRYHIGAVCDGAIRYLTSDDASAWIETTFTAPTDRLEVDPLLTLDGDTVYLAYSRLAPEDGGCGDDGLQDIGVYTRSRHLPNGSWSDPVRVGGKGDRAQSFRVVGGVLHLTITADDGGGPLYYESQSGPVVSERLIPDAVTTSLRVGDDGLPRIAYATGHEIRYARVDGARLTTETVAASDETYLMAPSLVLGPGDHAYAIWTQTTDPGGGCAGPEPGPLDGTYFGTDAGGRWKTTRLTRSTGESSLTLDPASGRIEVIVNDGSFHHFVSVDGATWTRKKIAGTEGLGNPVLRVNPATGSVSVFAVKWEGGIYVLTRR